METQNGLADSTSVGLETKDALVVGETSQGVEVRASLLRIAPQSVAFEIYSPHSVLRVSEVLTKLSIFSDNRVIYYGKATVSNIVNAGTVTVCEATLSDSWREVELFDLGNSAKVLTPAFGVFLDRWQKSYRILTEYKLAVADMQSFLEDLRLWLDQIELGIRASPSGNRLELERAVLRELPAAPAISSMFERFERAAASVPEDLIPAHRTFCRRQLHPLLLCSPFMYRIYTKPLGYAGDYEMIDMIMRNDYEGSSLFAKLLHSYILDQVPARAVRNRAVYFTRRFIEETSRVSSAGRIARIYSLGCGPAREVQTFLAEHALSDQAQFDLLDFNEETLRHVGTRLDQIRRQYHRKTPIKLLNKSVYHLLKGAAKNNSGEGTYDIIYCSGLYDYLSNNVCRALNTYLYDQLLPGGVLIVTNFDTSNPIRNIMEYMFEWFLIHRDGRQMAGLAPEQASPDDCKVIAELTGCNIFLEVRKPLSNA